VTRGVAGLSISKRLGGEGHGFSVISRATPGFLEHEGVGELGVGLNENIVERPFVGISRQFFTCLGEGEFIVSS